MINDKIIELLSEGSTEAFEKLYHQYVGKLYGFILKLTFGDSYLAEEITQRTFIKIWENRHMLNISKSFTAYMTMIARNILLNEYKHQTVIFVYEEYVKNFVSDKDETTEKVVNAKLLEEYVDDLIEKLPPACRKIFVLSRKEQLSVKEIAETLNLAESTVHNQLNKAVKFMRNHLAGFYKIILTFLLMEHLKY